jgi:hypothetical protein
VKKPVNSRLASAVTRTVSRLLLIDPGADNHVEPLLDEPRDHRMRARGVIGCIAVDQHVNVGIDVGKHSPHHVALALMHLPPHQRAGGACDVDRAIRRIVVVDVDRSLG